MEITSPPYAPIPPSLELPTPKRPILIDVYEARNTSSSGDHIDISNDAKSLDASRTLVSSTLTHLATEADPSDDVRKRVEDRVDDLKDPSADATSAAILRGVDDILPRDRTLRERVSAAAAALDRGLRETKSRLSGQNRLPDDFELTARRTVELVERALRRSDRDRPEVSASASNGARAAGVEE